MQDHAADFRPSQMTLSAKVAGVALVLCNDRRETFGAPDVLEVCSDRLSLQLCTERQFPDRPPNQVRASTALCSLTQVQMVQSHATVKWHHP